MISIVLYIVTVASIVALIALTSVSIHIYKKALELNPYTQSLTELLNSIKEANFTIERLQNEIDNLSAEKEESLKIIAKKEEVEQFLKDNAADIEAKQKEINKINEDLKEASKKMDKVTLEIKDLDEKKAILLADNQALELQKSGLNKELNLLNDELDKATEKEENLKEIISSLQDKEAILKASIQNLQLERDSLAKKVEELKREVEKLNEDKKKIGNAIGAANTELADITSAISEGKIELADINGTKKGIKNIEGKLWEDLDRDAPSFVIKKNWDKENDWLSTFKGNLKSYGIVFDDRTINAFHTALKVQDNSPLAVLSGISGTGKSLLPQLYAKSSGMNFLQVAVQPRWDSPQDMLGFYNYMQNKFKATELSRLLWHTDFYNNKNVSDKFKNYKNIPMNLVLLDEMNLARVEYYFSDLLSKLEVRRTITASDEKSRWPAEIEIEGGSISENKLARRLFVGKNTLFVGTMNEDETTQTLSDKVMDRANVLRFGKPKALALKANSEEFMNKYDSDIMPYGAWKEYLTEGNLGNNEKKLSEVIGKLNDELQRIGKPFAHRVWQSIDSYVKLYPGVNDSKNFNAALSDQIEMKVLPKLNGVEKDVHIEALKHIQNVIESVGDQLLFETFKKELDNPNNSFFQWKGVTR